MDDELEKNVEEVVMTYCKVHAWKDWGKPQISYRKLLTWQL
jgi:hypothetical protein